jgi:hypothetical protein
LQTDVLLGSVVDLGGNTHALDIDVQNFRLLTHIDKAQFDELYHQWRDDSLFDSLPDHMKAHESYQAMVALGDRAIPRIAAELRKEPSFLFLALEDITGANPVPAEDQGNLLATVDAWLTWLRK